MQEASAISTCRLKQRTFHALLHIIPYRVGIFNNTRHLICSLHIISIWIKLFQRCENTFQEMEMHDKRWPMLHL